jgi:hypothetical protein
MQGSPTVKAPPRKRGHNAFPGPHRHPFGNDWAYCLCGEAIVQFRSGVKPWFHLKRWSQRRLKPKGETK